MVEIESELRDIKSTAGTRASKLRSRRHKYLSTDWTTFEMQIGRGITFADLSATRTGHVLSFIEFSESRAHWPRTNEVFSVSISVFLYLSLSLSLSLPVHEHRLPIERFERRSTWNRLLGLDREIIFIQGSLSQPRSLSAEPDRKAYVLTKNIEAAVHRPYCPPLL